MQSETSSLGVCGEPDFFWCAGHFLRLLELGFYQTLEARLETRVSNQTN